MDVEQDGITLSLLEAGRTRDPRIDLGSVFGDCGEPLRRDELAACGEFTPDLGQLLLAHVQLAQMWRGRPRSRDHAVACVVAVEDDVAAEHELRLAPLGRDAVDVDVATVLDCEDDRAAVPDRLAQLRVGIALPVERRGQDPPVLAGLRVDDRDLRMARKVELRPDPT